MRKLLVLMLLGGALAPAHANNRCVAADGKVSYQDAPCASNVRESKRLDLVENTVEGRPYMPAARYGSVSAATFEDTVRIKCGNDWPGNTRMQNACVRNQVEGLRRSQAAIDASPEVAATIRLKCERQHPDNYSLRAACQRAEASVAARLGSR
jgi:hypothetical protein